MTASEEEEETDADIPPTQEHTEQRKEPDGVAEEDIILNLEVTKSEDEDEVPPAGERDRSVTRDTITRDKNATLSAFTS
jgi:hypothetical protein